MASPVEVIPGWGGISDRLDCTLVQLDRLIHHYADEPVSAGEDIDLDREVSKVSAFKHIL